MTAHREQITMESRQQWRDWLQQNHSISPGVLLVTWKKNRGRPRLAYDDIVEEALAVGWVDSQPRKLDEDLPAADYTSQAWQQLVTPQQGAHRTTHQRGSHARSGTCRRGRGASTWIMERSGRGGGPDRTGRSACSARPEPHVKRELGQLSSQHPTRHPRMDRQRQDAHNTREARHRNRQRRGRGTACEPVATDEKHLSLTTTLRN